MIIFKICTLEKGSKQPNDFIEYFRMCILDSFHSLHLRKVLKAELLQRIFFRRCNQDYLQNIHLGKCSK